MTVWLTAQEAADRLGISLRTLARYDDAGITHPRQVTERAHRKYDSEELDRIPAAPPRTTD